MPDESSNQTARPAGRIEDVEAPDGQEDDVEYQYLEHLQVSLYLETKALQHIWGQMRLVRDIPDFYTRLRNDMHVQILRVRYLKYQLGKVS